MTGPKEQIAWVASFIRKTYSREPGLKTWNRKQGLAARSGSRYYGDGGTIHGTGELDICMTPDGAVTQVWFRCQMLPFRVSVTEGREPVDREELPVITGIEVRDRQERGTEA